MRGKDTKMYKMVKFVFECKKMEQIAPLMLLAVSLYLLMEEDMLPNHGARHLLSSLLLSVMIKFDK